MKRPKLSDLTLREKIGQTGFPGVRDLRLGVINNGGYAEYFTKYPFTGMYADHALTKDNAPFAQTLRRKSTYKAFFVNISLQKAYFFPKYFFAYSDGVHPTMRLKVEI